MRAGVAYAAEFTDEIRAQIDLNQQIADEAPWGLVLTTNRQFPRHRPDKVIRLLVAALDTFLAAHQHTDKLTSETHWLQPN